jgi:hypothetical protein
MGEAGAPAGACLAARHGVSQKLSPAAQPSKQTVGALSDPAAADRRLQNSAILLVRPQNRILLLQITL